MTEEQRETQARKFVETDEYLRSYLNSTRRIEWLQEQIDKIVSSLDSVSRWHEVAVQCSPDPHRREKLLADIADRKKELRERIKTIELQGLEVIDTISKIDNPVLSKAMMMYYIDRMKMEQVKEHFDRRELPVDWWYLGVNIVVNMLDAEKAEN